MGLSLSFFCIGMLFLWQRGCRWRLQLNSLRRAGAVKDIGIPSDLIATNAVDIAVESFKMALEARGWLECVS